ncbi:MAG: hypothetical protein Q9P01_19700 [Anaerolineae bacterium]|nr:hypothetical protein [Anaerolineae bacterium]
MPPDESTRTLRPEELGKSIKTNISNQVDFIEGVFDPFDIAAKVTQNATKPIVATVATIVTPPQPKPAPKPDIKTILLHRLAG